MENDRRGKNLTTATVSVGNPNNHFGRRLKINGGVDSISSLPDEILHQILSLIPTKLAIKTSVLSQRWRHVWCQTPCLSFDSSSQPPMRETLASYSAAKIMSFHLGTAVDNKKKAQLANSLIDFAMSHNVDTLSLNWSLKGNLRDYNFPDFFFSNSSLKQLIVDAGYCRMIPKCTVSWTSLRSLSLSCCELSDASISKMLSGCPMLESLTLLSTVLHHYLDLSKSLRLRRLDIKLSPWGRETMQIVAPHIDFLRLRNLIWEFDKRQCNCSLVDVSSLTEANIDFLNCLLTGWCCYVTNSLEDVHLQAMVQTMLEKLQNVENLTLGVSFLQMLSIAESRGVPIPTFKVKTLTLETRILRSVIPGVAKLLQNSPGLKKITLYGIYCFTDADNSVNGYLDSQDLNPRQCWRLKDVASWKCEEFAEPKLVASFVELLLEYTKSLETLVLRLGRYFDRSRFGELSQITDTLSRDNKVSIVLK